MTLRDFSSTATCYAEWNGRVRPTVDLARVLQDRWSRLVDSKETINGFALKLTRSALICLRTISCAGIVLLGLACFSEWNFRNFLAPEAQAYQFDYPDALRGGLNPAYAAGHLLLLVGFVMALAGVVLVCFRNRRGLWPLAACAPAIAVGALLFDYGPTYPSLEPTFVTILWSCASAAWASVLTLAFVLLQRESPD